MSKIFARLAGHALVLAFASFAAAIWSDGDLSSRLGATGGLLIGGAFVLGLAAYLTSDAL